MIRSERRALERNALLVALTLGLVAGAAGPVRAQPVEDPFEAIVSSRDGSDAALNDLAFAARNPTGDELRQYLEAFRSINLNATLTVDRRSTFTVVNGTARIGPFSVKDGTVIRLAAGYEKRRGEQEAVLRKLEFIPSNPMALGPLRFNSMTLDDKGVLHFKLNLNLMGVSFWPQELTIEKIYRDEEGAMVFKTAGSGLAGAFVPDIRIKRDGTVQSWDRGTWFFGWRGGKWKDVKQDGQVVKLEDTLPIDRWPPRATDLLDWLPKPGAQGSRAASNGLDDLRPVLDAIPISDLALRFEARADPRRITLSDGRGHLDMSDHELRFAAHGRFVGRTYESDPRRDNTFLATGTVSGEVNEPGVGRTRIDRASVHLSGEHRARLPFEDPERVDLEVTARARAEANLSDLRAELPEGAYVVAPGRARADFEGDARLVLRPLTGDPDDRRELTISRDSRYGLTIDSPVSIHGADRLGAGLPTRLDLAAADDPSTPGVDESRGPVLSAEGALGTRMGFIFTKAEVRLNGATTTPGVVGILTGEGADRVEATTTLRPGARVNLYAYTFAGIRERTLEGGGARVTVDARVAGTGERTRVSAAGVTADLPGPVDVAARTAANVRFGTREGAVTEVRRVAAEGSVTLREGTGTVEHGLPGGPVLRGEVGAGTRLAVSTGDLRRADVRTGVLETDGFSRGERGATFEAHLVLEAGSVAHRDLALALRGRTTVDLRAAVGLRLDPRALSSGGQPLVGPAKVDLALSVDFARGTAFRTKDATSETTVRLTGPARVTAHGKLEVDATTGTPTLRSLEGVDVTITADAVDARFLLAPLGPSATATLDSRSTVRLRGVRVEFREDGVAIHHGGVLVELGAGTIVLGR